MFCVYILKSKVNQKYYVGQTENLERRLLSHNSGYSKSTKNGAPWELIYKEEYSNRHEAVRREIEIKKMKSKIYIENLINGRASR